MNATDSRPDHEPGPLLGLGSSAGLGPLPEAAAHTLEWYAHGGDDIGWLDFYAASDKVPSDWDGPPPDEVTVLFTAKQMRAYAAEQVAAERERCAQVVRYWLAGYAPDTVASHEARCLAHVLDGRPAPEGPNDRVKRVPPLGTPLEQRG